jgi:hypothetical protein
MSSLTRYWFKFEKQAPASAVNLGCGVTAYGDEDALTLLKERVFKQPTLPTILNWVRDIDISQLDPKQVLPNLGDPVLRGVWFPQGFDG